MMPPPPGAGLPGETFQLAGPTEPRSNIGQLFTLAILKAGRDGCTCAACGILKRVVDEMERALETKPDAGQG